MTTIQRIRREYDEPFKDVVIGFAEQGNSILLTARTLGISSTWLRNLCVRFDILKNFKPQSHQRETCKRNGGRGGNRLHKRLPMFYRGLVYWPSEPTNAMLYEQSSEAERREMIKVAKKLIKSVDSVTPV